ncbi:hypothetical protein FPY71_16635 [Aureimonas fodinaquatilis]|uniref:Imelysin-like domain-containing protein n=2 Tax=Aureimonas fodinaquatilis TaxID=2565783 RepID=A0A5B0DRM5_9HYPH|nr:hypothetical protein FPY71_16635 [Aureimonas fodinaquatilis]
MRVVLLLLAFFWHGTAIAQEQPVSTPNDAAIVAVMERAVDDFIRPGYRNFFQASAVLDEAMRNLCSAPSQGNLAQARDAFKTTIGTWSQIEILRVGPAIEGHRFERILYYPDRKSIGLKQVQGLLAKPDPAATTVEGLAGKSVAVQGLGALEFLLYGTGADELAQPPAGFRCQYGAAIARNIHDIAHELSDAWDDPDGIARDWKTPGQQNPEFRNAQEAMTALLGVLVHGAEAARDQRIESFYRGPDRTAFPKQALFWRSGNTWVMLSGNLAGLQALYDSSRMADLVPNDSLGTRDSIHFLINAMQNTITTLNPDIETALADSAQRGKLDYLLLSSKDLILRFNDEFGGAIGLAAGFSFSDGD